MKEIQDNGGQDQIQGIYRQLKKGLGRELVNDDNVGALIELAARDGEQILEQELREWQAPCGVAPDASAGGLHHLAPNPGFNKTHVKH
ncbi:hypothetical protein [Azohydromonas aeria]|uniref:hypothetical protein n=1 Tax=Azohydromonas aeria TaxID=2590212 RepID=UPI0012FB45F5|nr:hypothetical protein [Azohydromonas aeria]